MSSVTWSACGRVAWGSEGMSCGWKDGRHPITRAIMRAGSENLSRGPGGVEDRGRAHNAGHQEGVPEGPLSGVTRVTRGKINIWHSQTLLWMLAVSVRLLLRASISERHLAFTKFDSFHIAQSSWNLPVYNERTLGGGRSHSPARQKQDRNGAARGNPGKASAC